MATDYPWVGCGECDCIFPCYEGRTRCRRLDPPDEQEDLLARIVAIEDELGITEKRDTKKRVKALKEVYLDYGFSVKYAKMRAWGDERSNITPDQAENELIRRGAVKRSLDI